jgi:hypothetical protein
VSDLDKIQLGVDIGVNAAGDPAVAFADELLAVEGYRANAHAPGSA